MKRFYQPNGYSSRKLFKKQQLLFFEVYFYNKNEWHLKQYYQ